VFRKPTIERKRAPDVIAEVRGPNWIQNDYYFICGFAVLVGVSFEPLWLFAEPFADMYILFWCLVAVRVADAVPVGGAADCIYGLGVPDDCIDGLGAS
jgi:hypothetical protein